MDIERWRQHVLEPLLEGHEPTADADGLDGLALLAADTDRTQDYVFESAKLPEVRGASRRLDDLNDHIAGMVGQAFHEKCVVYAGGGSLLALVPGDESQLERLCGEIEALYPKETDVATITVDWRMVTPKMVRLGYPDGGFGGLARWAGGWLRRWKEDKPPGPFFEAPPHAIRCRSCSTRPADPCVSFPDWPLCKTCKDKRIYEGRRVWFHRFQQFLADHTELSKEYYAQRKTFPSFPSICKEGEASPRQLPQDLSELGQASRARKGYVGFIHLDGDDFGDLFHHLPIGARYHQFSTDIAKTAEYVVMAALATHLHPAQVQASEARQEVGEELTAGELVWIHPFEIITIGGDDIWLIVPGDRAIPIAAAISTAFSERMCVPGESGKRCTMSGGVVIADDHNPVRILQDLAKKLTREAKCARHEAKAEAEVNVGYIDFHIFKSADMLDREVSTLRRKYPYTLSGLGEHGKDLRLMARPYPADVLHKLWQKLEALRGPGSLFPTSQMHRLAEALLLGRHQSTLFYEYQRARDTDDEYFKRLDDALRAVQGDRVRDPTPWKDLKHDLYSHQTALWDIAEMYEFVSREGKSQ